jgi:squalene-hopene/tetraprenyl-beta-curcumene cyclase
MMIKLVGIGLCATLAAACSSRSEGSTGKPLVCGDVPVKVTTTASNPDARKAAQHGLAFLTTAAKGWTDEHKCFGCHVQGVTMEALAVGMHHQYDVRNDDIDAMVRALQLGVTAGGHVTGTAFQGQAWARYDMWVNGSHTDDLLKYTTELVQLQHEDGSVPDDDARLPVTGGTMHTTYQAMQTWRQAYARTADDKWLTPMRKAERYLALQSSDWQTSSEVYIQNINFALLGLVAANVGAGEQSSMRLQKILLSRQNQDGGWGLDPKTSDALATGQTLYALRLAGHGDGEGAIDRGIKWLIEHQGKDGAWHTVKSGQGGAEKGEAMWAVLGLVSVDVTSVAVNGLVDGQHVAPTMKIAVEARDNMAGGVRKVELFLDDQPLAGACTDKLTHEWKTAGLGDGKHTIDVVATNSKLQTSRRRYEVYAGNVFLTDLGARFDEGRATTEIGVRNIAADKDSAGKVQLSVYATDDAGKRGAKVFDTTQAGAPGAMTFAWSGTSADGKAQPRGRYIAELAFRDASGDVIQKTETVFVHDSEAAQRAKFGEIEGNLAMDSAIGAGGGSSANTTVELVDKTGNVVQTVHSTEQGNYRFKGVAKGDYKVRITKKGFNAKEANVEAKPNAPAAKADMMLH